MKETNETKGRQPTEWEKIFANRMPKKKLISKTYKECIQLNKKNGYHQKDNKQQVLVRCGGNGTLVYSWWKQIYAAPMENRMEVPQKIKHRTAL